MLRAQTRLLELLQNEEDSPWYADAATGRRRTRKELIETALQLSVHRLRREVNPTPRKWAWGRMHQIRYNHTLGSAPILGWLFNRGPYPIGGDGTTPNQTAFMPELPPGLVQVQAVYRQIFEIGIGTPLKALPPAASPAIRSAATMPIRSRCGWKEPITRCLEPRVRRKSRSVPPDSEGQRPVISTPTDRKILAAVQ